ncbi:hypothetical protein IWX90DRAFT_516941 [Phyllosticta citrichinensis]|uniref:Vacuolar ATPase assembly protein VMA22 n=1 Tax=Phyllosticta citrichinensis TaxID=1130410 RepID=A0ABR1XIT3_9PEZI
MAESTHAMPPERIQPKLSGAAATTELVERLDDLLKRYLELLDQYTQAREQLSTELSAGYIALAKANFNAPNRVRYGRDFYDERTQALRTVTIEERDDAKFRASIVLAADSEPTEKVKVDEKPASTPPPPSSPPTDPEVSKYPTPPPDSPSDAAQPSGVDSGASQEEKEQEGQQEKDEEEQKRKQQQQRQRDPIRWFGILVPQALRSAQGIFVGAVETAVPQTLNLAAEMRELEIEIGRARKAIRKSGA